MYILNISLKNSDLDTVTVEQGFKSHILNILNKWMSEKKLIEWCIKLRRLQA